MSDVELVEELICKTCKKTYEKEEGKVYKNCESCREKERTRRLCEHGKRATRCIKCGGGSMCEHNREKSSCKECKGASICEHNRMRRICKDCGGKGICEHQKEKHSCKECKGTSICIHNRRRQTCKECKGASICEHNRMRRVCKDCGGKGICEHNRRRTRCKDCGGSEICPHNRQSSMCKDCKGKAFCEHGKIRYYCKECGGGSFCGHGRRKNTCKHCKGSRLCTHDKDVYQCVICTPKNACQNCLSIFVHKNYRFHPYCFSCYCTLNPDAKIPCRFMLKEHHLRDALKDVFSQASLIFNKSVGESRKRPDTLIPRDSYNIVIECDENQHKNYDCENKREMEIFQDLGNKPLVMIRFNPDAYTDENGKKIPGCFSMTKTVGWKVDKKEWEKRIEKVIETIQEYIDDNPTKDYTRIYLFYSDDTDADSADAKASEESEE